MPMLMIQVKIMLRNYYLMVTKKEGELEWQE